MGQTENLWGIQGKDTCALFTEMGSRLTNKISRNVKQFFWEEGSNGWMDGRMAGLENIKKTGFFAGFLEKQCREDYQRNHCLFYRQTRSSTCENKILGYLSVGSICYSRRNSDTKALQ